jgi:hypothetical protein
MAEPDGNGISARLWRLPGQLLLALINATAILVIVAAIITLVAISRINHFAENITAKMTEAVLSKVDLPERDVLANIRNLTAEVRTLGNTLREIKDGERQALQPELAKLKEALTVLNVSIDRIGNARSLLTDEAIGQLGRTVTDGLMKLRDCSSSARQVERPPRNKTVEAEPFRKSRSMKTDFRRDWICCGTAMPPAMSPGRWLHAGSRAKQTTYPRDARQSSC